MKKIEAIFRRNKLVDVRKALEQERYPGMTISEVRGHGKGEPITQQWRGREYKVELLPYLKLEIVVTNEDISRVTRAIIRSARTGEVGDGKVFVIPVDDAVRVRTGEGGDSAI